MPRRKGIALTERDIVEAAIACIEKDGIAGLGVNRVARELGIQPPSLYNHVAGNEGLRRAVAIEGERRLLQSFTYQASGISAQNCLFRSFAYAYRRFAHQNPDLYAVMSSIRLETKNPDYVPVEQAILAFFTAALRPFGLVGDEVVYAMRTLRSALHGFVELERAKMFNLPQSVDESFEWLISTLISALQQKHEDTKL